MTQVKQNINVRYAYDIYPGIYTEFVNTCTEAYILTYILNKLSCV